MLRSVAIVSAWTLVAFLAGTPGRAAEKPGEKKKEQTPVATWSEAKQQAPPGENSLYEEALNSAPILWFSDDEPLLRVSPGGKRHFLPAPLPCDPKATDTKRPIVYYKLDNVRVNRALEPEERHAVYEGRLPLDSLEHMRINYYFYYPEDKGLNPHIHDIESVSMELDVIREKKGGKAKVERNRVTGWAHGSELMANILQIKPSIRSVGGAPDTRSPVTILVEEGKHASCPDRNGDGIYTPGIDVNVRVADAWGIRDVFGGGVIGSRYQSFMTKNRLTPVMAGTVKLTKGLSDLTAEVDELRRRVEASAGAAPAGPAERSAQRGHDENQVHDPTRYRIGPDLPPSHPVFRTYEEERRVNGGLEFPTLRYELRDIRSIPAPYCADVEAPFPRGWKRLPVDPTSTAKRLDWSSQGHIFQASCPAPETPQNTDDRADAGEDVLFLKEPDSDCGYLNLPASVAKLQGRPPINRIKLTYKYGTWWPIQPFRNAFVGARYDRGGAGFTAGFYSGYGLPKFGGWFNAGATVVRRNEHWGWSTNLWFTPSIATLATWYVGTGYDHLNDALAESTGHWALEGGVQIRHGSLGLRLGVRSRVSAARLSSAGLVSEFVFGPLTRGARVH
jgi:hypothetical protein